MAQQVAIGRIVQYVLTKDDAQSINQKRAPLTGPDWPARAIVNKGNPVSGGDTYPMMITRVWSAETGMVNGQVFLDGNDVLWVTGVDPGEGQRHWHWPERA